MTIPFCAINSTRPKVYNFTMEMAFTFWEKGCGWSISGTMWRTAPHHTKVGSQLFQVKNRIHIFQGKFHAGNMHTHTNTSQCVVLNRLTFLATMIFATVGL